MMIARLCAGMLVCAGLLVAQQAESVDEIMAKVAANQDRSQEIRSAYVYHQSLLLRFHRGNGKVAREELRDYEVTATPKGTKKDLKHFAGKYEKDGKFIEYGKPGFTYKDIDLDGELIDDFAEDFANDKKSRDGISADLFPLTTQEQKKYRFKLGRRERFKGRDVFKITFQPIQNSFDSDSGTPWAGEILVDVHEYQPVYVATQLAKGIPIAVQVLLGTNIRGLGFKLEYAKLDDGVWFPMNYGTEFELKAVFFYRRKIAIALRNDGFKRADVSTRITFDTPLIIDKTLRPAEVKVPPP